MSLCSSSEGGPFNAEYANRGLSTWSDPFFDQASLALPTSIQSALRWCEYLLMANGPYRAALERVLSYFLTDVEIMSSNAGKVSQQVSGEEKQKYKDFLENALGIRSALKNVGMDLLAYGNSFTSVYVPLRRHIACKKCGYQVPLRIAGKHPEFKFKWEDYKFHAVCPKCKYSGEWGRVDVRLPAESHMFVKRWSPHDIEILYDEVSEESAYIWRIPETYRSDIKKGNLFRLERADWEIIEAIKNDDNLMLSQDTILHLKEEPFSGIRHHGWGLSRVLTNFRQAWIYQVLNRYNEAIALDFIVPCRVITPATKGGASPESADPVFGTNLGLFTRRVTSMIRRWRKDPAEWNVLPYGLEYHRLGGEGTQLAPKDLMEFELDVLLNSVGVPMELYRGTLQAQAAPLALRLFEATWAPLVHQLNNFLNHLVDKVAATLEWEPVNARLRPTTHADDLNRQMAKMQLMMSDVISRSTGLEALGLDFAEEERRKIDEQVTSAELQEEAQNDLEQAAMTEQMVAPPPPGQPAPGQTGGQMPMMQGMDQTLPGGGVPAQSGGAPMAGAAGMFASQMPTNNMQPQTPDEMLAKADMLASQVLGMQDWQRKSFLIQLKREDPFMHSLVSQRIKDIRQQAQTVGANMVLQQQYGGGGMPAGGAGMPAGGQPMM